MKKLFSLLLVALIVLSFASCKINEKSSNDNSGEAQNEATETNSQNDDSEEEKTTVNYSKVLKELNRVETKFVDSLGVTEEGKKIVAFFGDDFEIQFIVAEFEDGKVSMVKDYRFFEEDSKYEAYKILAQNSETGFIDHEDEKCIEIAETKKYRGKTYEEMKEVLAAYNFKYE